MAWIAACCINDGRPRKKPSRLMLSIILIGIILGVIVPLIFLLSSAEGSASMSIFPMIFIFIVVLGLLTVSIALIEPFDQNEEKKEIEREAPTKTPPRRSVSASYRRSRSRDISYCEPEVRNVYHWGSEPKAVVIFCTKCGVRLELDDQFCYSCGWRVI